MRKNMLVLLVLTGVLAMGADCAAQTNQVPKTSGLCLIPSVRVLSALISESATKQLIAKGLADARVVTNIRFPRSRRTEINPDSFIAGRVSSSAGNPLEMVVSESAATPIEASCVVEAEVTITAAATISGRRQVNRKTSKVTFQGSFS